MFIDSCKNKNRKQVLLLCGFLPPSPLICWSAIIYSLLWVVYVCATAQGYRSQNKFSELVFSFHPAFWDLNSDHQV